MGVLYCGFCCIHSKTHQFICPLPRCCFARLLRRWTADLATIDLHYYLPIFVDGLQETQVDAGWS